MLRATWPCGVNRILPSSRTVGTSNQDSERFDSCARKLGTFCYRSSVCVTPHKEKQLSSFQYLADKEGCYVVDKLLAHFSLAPLGRPSMGEFSPRQAVRSSFTDASRVIGRLICKTCVIFATFTPAKF